MNPDEVKDKLKNVINSLIKDDPDQAKAELHAVLAAKMRNRISPEDSTEDEDVMVDDEGSDNESEDEEVTD